MTPAGLRLQLIGLALLWLQLLLQGQLQVAVAIALPLLLLLKLRPRKLPRPAQLGLTVAALLVWSLGASMGDRSALLQSCSNLLWLLSGLKLLEARGPREQRQCGLLLLVATGLAGLAAQALAASLLQGLVVLLALASLLSLDLPPLGLGALLRRTGVLVALTLPVLIAAFVLLPRLEPLWQLSPGAQARTGLSERLAPGELASLVQDDGLAARVSFANGTPPGPEQRYWRVLVHQRFDGNSWSGPQSAPPALQLAATSPQPAGPQPPLQRWLVEANGLRQRPWGGVGRPQAGSQLQLLANGTLQASRPLTQRSLYTLTADPGSAGWRHQPPTPLDLELPATANPRLRVLGAQWRAEAAAPEARLELAHRWFMQQGFRYTLTPGSLGRSDPLDGFLFETQAGFCEHFAASLSALMRAAGVPARVVVGYQGGDWQRPIGAAAYLELRNSNAHAWSEIWLPNQGWVTVDPTAWVVPEQIRQSLAASLRRPLPAWLQVAAAQWDGLDYRWQLWVMGFDRQRQIALLGNSPWQGLWALGAIAAALLLGLWPLLSLLNAGDRGDRPQRELQRLLSRLQRHGFALQSGESLPAFCQRVAARQPLWRIALAQLCADYQQWRFGNKTTARQAQQHRRAVLGSIRRCRQLLRAPALQQRYNASHPNRSGP